MMHEAAGRTGAQLYKKALSLIIAFAGVLALPSALLLEGKGLGYSNGFLPVCLLLLALPTIHAALWKEGALRQAGLPAFLLGLGFALATSVGSRLEAEGYLLLTDWTLWLCLLPLALFFGSRSLALGEDGTAGRREGKRPEDLDKVGAAFHSHQAASHISRAAGGLGCGAPGCLSGLFRV